MKPAIAVLITALSSAPCVYAQNARSAAFATESTQPSRTWTSQDGRTLEAVLIARTENSVTLRRSSDGREFTLPLTALSSEDRHYANNSGVPKTEPKTFNNAKLAELKKSIPPIRPDAPLEASYPNIIEFHSRYERLVNGIGETGYARHLVILKQQMESDLKRFQAIAATALNDPPTYSEHY